MSGKIARTVASKVYVSVIVSALWYGGTRVAWPRPWLIAAAVAAAVVLAFTAQGLVWWTRTLGDGIPVVEHTIRALVWLGVLAAVALWMIANPAVGILGAAFVLHLVGHTWPEPLHRLWRWIRREGTVVPTSHYVQPAGPAQWPATTRVGGVR